MRVAVLLLLVACSGAPAPTPSEPASPPGAAAEVPEVVQTAANVARSIAQNPDDAARILADRGLTEDRFEEMLFQIAENPAWTKEYERLRK
jgi:hypothetical protein